jgi:DNA primase
VRPEDDPAREHAATEIGMHPEWVEGLTAGLLLERMASSPVSDNPLDAADTAEQRVMLARVLEEDTNVEGGVLLLDVRNALNTLERGRMERRQRELRGLMAEAERRGDSTMASQLAAEAAMLARSLRMT